MTVAGGEMDMYQPSRDGTSCSSWCSDTSTTASSSQACFSFASGDDEAEAAAMLEDVRPLPQQSKQFLKEVMSDPLLLDSGARSSYCQGSSPLMPAAASFPFLEDHHPEWPREVYRLLAPKGAPRRSSDARMPATTGLRLHAGAFQIPHPSKAETGGEDSFFVSSDGFAAGVADGVGEWEWRFKLNPRAFADELMSGACAWAKTQREFSSSAKASAASALSESFAASKSYGSSTSLVAIFDAATSELGVANLGDSGLRQIRRSRQQGGSSKLGAHIVGNTVEQQHGFNCPFQLSHLPEPADFPQLLAEGKGALVRAVQNSSLLEQDQPSDADLYSFSVEEGDLIILGTDGVFDNLHDREVCQLIDHTTSPLEAGRSFDLDCGTLDGCGSSDPVKVAEAIAEAAFYRSRDSRARVPFALHAKEAGRYHAGGKSDDITVVAAWVVRSHDN
jgi:protein phosphatase PTC7